MKSINFIEAPFSLIKEKVNENFILLVTATDTETKHLHQHLTPIDEKDCIYKIYKENQTYFLAVFEEYNVVHIQCGMGSASRDASIITIGDAIRDVCPKVVIMIGIAFGINRKKQNIGDVLVSEVIIPYELSRVGERKISRSGHGYANVSLVNRFKNNKSWEHRLPKDKQARIIVGHILSGEKLIDDIEFRNQLLEEFPNSVGGEMEGAGLFAACNNKSEWILIKGICDFADGKKGVRKKDSQAIAIESAISASKTLFSSIYIFDGLDIKPNGKNESNNRAIEIASNGEIRQKLVIELPTSPAIVAEIVEEFVDSHLDNKMLNSTQSLVQAYLSLTEADKSKVVKNLNLEVANMIEIPGHLRDRLVFLEIKSKKMTSDLWEEVFKLLNENLGESVNPFK